MIQERAFEESSERLIFNERTGTLIKLSNGRRTAERKRPLDEFNNGVVMTNRPIKDDEMFEVDIIFQLLEFKQYFISIVRNVFLLSDSDRSARRQVVGIDRGGYYCA